MVNFLRRLYPGINTRITVPFLVLIVIVAGVGVFIATRLVAGSIEERLNNQLIDSASAAHNSIVEVERQQLATLRLMIFTEGVAQAMATNDVVELSSLLQPIAVNEQIDDVIVFDRNGQAIFELRRRADTVALQYETPAPPDVQTWGGVQRVLANEVDSLGDKYVDVIGEVPEVYLYITAPVVDADEQLVGGISLGLRATSLVVRVREQALSAVTLFDTNGQVISTTFRSETPEILQLSQDRVEELQQAARDQSVIKEQDIEGDSYQVLYTSFRFRSQNIGFIAVALRKSFVVERIGTSRNTFALLFSVLFISVAFIGIRISRSIAQPVQQLVATTRAIRDGDLSRRVGLSTPDELGELSTSFDHMTDQLVARNDEINELYLMQRMETIRREAILSSISDAVIVFNSSGRVILMNRSAENLIERLRPNGELYRTFVHLCRKPQHLMEAQTVTLADEHFSVVSTPADMPSGEELGYVIVFRDITAIVEAERIKDDMIMQLSHELRTPLTAARGYVDVVRQIEINNLSPMGADFVNKAVESVSSLTQVVNQVIDVSAITANKFSLNIEKFNLATMINSVVDELQPEVKRRNLTISTDLSSTDMWIEGDQDRLRLVLKHLLKNAYNYTPGEGHIDIIATIENNRAIVSVADNGIGVDPEEQERVFDRMYRGRVVSESLTQKRGLGLGLYISKHIIEAHSGIIELESILDYGTVVTIDIPVQQ